MPYSCLHQHVYCQDVIDRAYPHGPLDLSKLVSMSVGVTAFVFIISVLGLAFATVMLYFVLRYRFHPIIRASSPLFSALAIVGGLIMIYGAMIPAISNSPSVCLVDLWIFGFGYILLFGYSFPPFRISITHHTSSSPIFAKTFRIYRIFATKITIAKLKITNTYLLKILAVLFLLELVILLVWSIVDPLTQSYVPYTGGTQLKLKCLSRNWQSFWAVFIAYKVHVITYYVLYSNLNFSLQGILLATGIYLTIRARVAFKLYNESMSLGWSLYNATLISCIVVPLAFYDELTPDAYVLIKAIAQVLVASFTLGMLYLPKLYQVLTDNERDKFTYNATTKSMPGTSVDRQNASVVEPDSQQPQTAKSQSSQSAD